MPAPVKITYVSSSRYKAEENEIFRTHAKLADGTRVADVAKFEMRELNMKEILEVDIRIMVQAEVAKAYSEIKVPCIVEHAGLIFEQYRMEQYPGGLTKPMWNTLKDRFIDETQSAGRRVTAMAVVAYCDGMNIHTFVGETPGVLAPAPRGKREFYWDSVFVPDDPSGRSAGKTYAEIVEDPTLGLPYKVLELSQSSRAMLAFVDHLRSHGRPKLWS